MSAIGHFSGVIVGLLSVSGMLDWLIPTGGKVTEEKRRERRGVGL